MINYKYNLHLKIDDMIEFAIVDLKKHMIRLEEIRLTFTLMAISCFSKTDFNIIDKRFKDFGSTFYQLMRDFAEKKLVDYEIDFIRGSFSEFMLNNFGFSKSELFPEKDIQMIKNKLQVELLLDGKNFILLPDVLVKCSDIQFHFK
jgi:hypothetical protein